MSERIDRIEAWQCSLPMPYELHLGAITYRTRDYVLLRLTTASGVVGSATGYTRGTPLMAALSSLASDVTAMEDISPAAVHSVLRRRYAPGWGAMARAGSLIDVALWDIAAQMDGVPLGQALGGADHDVSLMAVAGYFLDHRGVGPILDEVAEFVDQGYRTIKLIVPGHDLATDMKFVADVVDRLNPQVGLGIDFHGAFTTVDEAVAYGSAFRDFDLDFIEDPFPSYEIGAVTAAAKRLTTPVASGEDLMSATSYDLLVADGVRVVRADVSASGGYTEVLAASQRARAAGARVAPHVWPHLHFPLALAAADLVEVIPHTTGADPIDQVLYEPFPIKDGRWKTQVDPGLYLPIDWARAALTASASFVSTS
ncbi:mandelate racemase/muconate lactonizing enzyme family protein [Microbacterium testaceum]|uniref:mandelate racemase/muconate lactonizing enzyme family protein n=1 Tax=Microbacterium testaceum TaxID=2033 RepID=UPI001243D844|nr:enolase C-terminal domain-like protein [Microbacterium testaceum]